MTKRVCERSGCHASLEGFRKDARFCSDRCRTADWAATHPESVVQRLHGPERAKSGPRRKSRDGLGTKVYLTRAELQSLHAGLSFAPRGGVMRARVVTKLVAAIGRTTRS